MRNGKRGRYSLRDFKRQIMEYFDPCHMLNEPVVLTGNRKEHFIMYDAEADRIMQEMARAGLKELRAALSDVAAGRTKPARSALNTLAKKFDIPFTDK